MIYAFLQLLGTMIVTTALGVFCLLCLSFIPTEPTEFIAGSALVQIGAIFGLIFGGVALLVGLILCFVQAINCIYDLIHWRELCQLNNTPPAGHVK